ncbi:hypothetical protein Thein_1361 [Thermodesulfatator indicus DSM 15286]|uniref:Uncharacterized protein n=1 Tax=Thermodesulfatator indicus (strain DSM 15286 / JCM 11887 / CIR29812) TaxID=667014 RepID=F8A9K1_THEID|nr:hypothetical protein Thein_1361 [Thermodesulfatator indicus DSM 15286]
MRVVLEVENSKEGRALINCLKQLPFVKIRESQKLKKEHKFEEIFGIWKDRNITKEKLREKAWRM